MAEEILNQNIKNIKQLDGVEKPDINFLMGEAFISFSLKTKIKSECYIILSYCFSLSNFLNSFIGPIVVNKTCLDTFEKASLFLEIANSSFNVLYSVIKVSDRELNKEVRKYRAPLGWITYFSNENDIKIPKNLEYIKYKYIDNGTYLILTKENPEDREILYGEIKTRLLSLMKQIELEVLEYLK
ncbi:MAG: hypothetical protein ACON5F_08635 [Jejuia sp.]